MRRLTPEIESVGHEASQFRLDYQFEGQMLTRTLDQPRILIGRSTVCDLSIDSPCISRKHAEIIHDGTAWVIEDLHSRNGITVNRQIVTRQVLKDGDEIVLGPAGITPVTLHFCRQTPQGPQHERFLVNDAPDQTIMRASIDLKEFERNLAKANVTQVRVLSLFKEVSEILLATDDLDAMMRRVLALALDHLPGQRGLICLSDEATGQIEPKSFYAKGHGEQPFSVSRSILSEAIRSRRATLVTNAKEDPRFLAAVSVVQIGIRAAMCVPLYHAEQVKGIIYIDSQRTPNEFNSQDLEMLAGLGLMVAVGITQTSLRNDVLRERSIRDRLSKYHSPRVVEQIIGRVAHLDTEMLAEEREVSVLFADLTSFTSLSEHMPPADVIRLLNTVFTGLAAAVFEYDGTLDKYIGDAVMAVFGAPIYQTDHARRAVATALRMQKFLVEFNEERVAETPLRMRIGINSGPAIAGDIGSALRKEYTVIGDVVNTASRLETSVAQPGDIVIGAATYEQVKNSFQCEPLPEICLRGKRESVRPYRVLGISKTIS